MGQLLLCFTICFTRSTSALSLLLLHAAEKPVRWWGSSPASGARMPGIRY